MNPYLLAIDSKQRCHTQCGEQLAGVSFSGVSTTFFPKRLGEPRQVIHQLLMDCVGGDFLRVNVILYLIIAEEMAPCGYFSHEKGCHEHISLAVAIPQILHYGKINLVELDSIAVGEFGEFTDAVVRIDEISPNFPVCLTASST